MIDFDDLVDAEVARDEEEAPLRAAEEARAAAAFKASQWTARVVAVAAVDGQTRGLDRVPVYGQPDPEAEVVGERHVGDIVCLSEKANGFCLLHPLELQRVAVDYQEYWNAILANEVPRLASSAWLPSEALRPVERQQSPEETDPGTGAPEPFPGAKEEDLDLEDVRRNLTVIVSTSPAEHHCSVLLMLRVLGSLQANPGLQGCRKLVVFDAMPGVEDAGAVENGSVAESGRRWVPRSNEKLAQAYERYKSALREACARGEPAMQGVELLFLPRWGHLVGTVRYAMDHLSTPYVLLHQHDLLLSHNFTSKHLLAVLRALARGEANYVLLNRDVNFVWRSTQYFQAAPHRPDLWRVFQREQALQLQLDSGEATLLTPFIGFSDQTHLARSEWLKSRVLSQVGDRKCCMEFAMHEVMILSWLHSKNQCRWERTFMLGGMDDGPYIYDSQKNGYCWAAFEDAYSEEKTEDCSCGRIEREDVISHPRRPDLCLSLYIFRPASEQCPPTMFHYPDTDMDQNRLSRELFDPDGRACEKSRAAVFGIRR